MICSLCHQALCLTLVYQNYIQTFYFKGVVYTMQPRGKPPNNSILKLRLTAKPILARCMLYFLQIENVCAVRPIGALPSLLHV
jgi:hypothetical protein